MSFDPSSPVAGTNDLLGLSTPEKRAPVAAPVADFGAVARALIQAGNALLLAASALQGSDPKFTLSNPCNIIPLPDSPLVADAINTFLIAKARAGKSDRYLRTMKNSLSKFARGRGSRPLASITAAEIEKWIAHNDWNGTTRRGYLRDVRTLLNFAVRRNLIAHNPANAVELPQKAPAPVHIHTPGEVRRVLEAARRHDVNLCRALAIRYFAGLRSAECDRLREENIKTEQGIIEVTAQSAKTRQRRVVKIQPALRAWLAIGGALPLHDINNRMRKFSALLREMEPPIVWEHNVTRHSFCSYHLARFKSAAKTALEAGHSEAMLFGHYREIVTAESAAEFWSILP